MKFILASALLCCSLAVYAAPETPQINNQPEDTDAFDFMLAAGITFGGDDLISTTGGEVSVTSGGLFYMAAGGVYHFSQNFEVQASFGYHFDSVTAENGTADFSRTFIEVLPFYKADSGNRFGIGFTQVMSPEFSGPFGDGSFDDTSGMIIEYDWSLAQNSSGFMKDSYIGLRYVNLTYEKNSGILDFDGDGSAKDSVDGSYIGLLFQGNF